MRTEHKHDWLQRFAENGAEAAGEGNAAAQTGQGTPERAGTAPAADAGEVNAHDTDAQPQAQERADAARRGQALRLVQEEARARAQFAGILRQSEEMRRKYPDFDLRAEMARPGSVHLLRAGVPLETVYEFNHRRELAAAAVTAGAERVAAGVAANQSRPAEAGGAGTGSAGVSVDPAHLTRAQREDIKRRVAAGERIVLSAYTPR